MIPWRVVKIGARFWCKLRNANIPPMAKKPTMPHPVTPNQNHHSQTHAQTQSKHPSPRNLNLKPPHKHINKHIISNLNLKTKQRYIKQIETVMTINQETTIPIMFRLVAEKTQENTINTRITNSKYT